jgi:hypothetical protein
MRRPGCRSSTAWRRARAAGSIVSSGGVMGPAYPGRPGVSGADPREGAERAAQPVPAGHGAPRPESRCPLGAAVLRPSRGATPRQHPARRARPDLQERSASPRDLCHRAAVLRRPEGAPTAGTTLSTEFPVLALAALVRGERDTQLGARARQVCSRSADGEAGQGTGPQLRHCSDPQPKACAP